jgi:hypothetical protein
MAKYAGQLMTNGAQAEILPKVATRIQVSAT